MEIILLGNVKKLGQKGDVKNVSEGYLRNFLLPKKLAIVANEKIKLQIKKEVGKKEQENDKISNELNKFIDKLKELKIIIKAKANETGKLFSAITKNNIIDHIQKETNHKLSEKEVILKSPIKLVGMHDIEISTGAIKSKLTIEINDSKKL